MAKEIFLLFSFVYFEEGEVAFFSAKRWDRRNRAGIIECPTPCHDAQVVGLYWDSNPLRLTILAAMSEDYTTAPQHLQIMDIKLKNQLWISKPIMDIKSAILSGHLVFALALICKVFMMMVVMMMILMIISEGFNK